MSRKASHPAQSLSTRAIALAAFVTVTGLTMNASAATYVYGPVVSATDDWSTGTNWDSAPVSASTTTLRFGGTDAAAAAISASATVISSNNDIAGNFTLNQFILSYRGITNVAPSLPPGPVVTVSGNALEFVNDGATTPTMLLRANSNSSGTTAYKPVTTVSNNLILGSNLLTITANTNNNGGTTASVVNVTGSLSFSSTGLHTIAFGGAAASGNNFGGAASFAGVISNSAVGVGNETSITKSGLGHWRLSAANDYTGTTTVNGGVLESTAAGGLGTGAITVNDGGTVGLRGAGTYTNNISITGLGKSVNPSTVSVTPGAIWLGKDTTLSGTVTLTGNSRISVAGAAATDTATVSGKITGDFAMHYGTGAGSASGILIISNSGNDYTGDTTLLGGPNSGGNMILRSGASEVIPHGAGKGNVILSSSNSVTLDLRGNNETINALISSGGSVTGGRTVTNGVATPATLTLGAGDASGTYAYTISGGANLALTKIGTGTQTLSGVNTYTGTTTVSDGVLNLGFNDAAPNNSQNASNVLSATTPLVLNGGTLRITERENTTEYNESLTTTATSSGTAFNLNVADASGLRVGQTVSGTNIPDTRYISRISGNTVVISGAGAVTAGTDTVTFAAEVFTTTQTFASLDLAASSTLDFGLAGDSTTLQFGSVTQSVDGTTLSIANWSGIVDVGGGAERLLFTGSPTDFSSVFSQSEVNFIGQQAGYQLIDLGGSYEVVPGAIPEPASLSVLALGGLGLLSRRLRRR